MKPTRRELEVPILLVLMAHGGEATNDELYHEINQRFPGVTQAERDQRYPDSNNVWEHDIRAARDTLREQHAVELIGTRNRWRITGIGRQLLAAAVPPAPPVQPPAPPAPPPAPPPRGNGGNGGVGGNADGDLPNHDQRQRALATIILRPQQAQFRRSLRDRYGDQCQISGCVVMEVVQACHLHRVSDGGGDGVENGLLLRADIHVLFDADVIGIDPDTLLIHVDPILANTEYAGLDGLPLRVGHARPDDHQLRQRWAVFTAVRV
jgi:hypothetical protein